MLVDPVFEGVKALTHSAPTVTWWLGLNAAEQAAWCAAFMGLLAAVGGGAAALASFYAARTALRIAGEQTQRQENKDAIRAEVHAAFIFHELSLVYGYVDAVRPLASALSGPAMAAATAHDIAGQLRVSALKWLELINDVDRKSIALLPDECGAATAGAISSARFACTDMISSGEKFARTRDIDAFQRRGRPLLDRCYSIRENLAPYQRYAKRRFGSDFES